VFPLHLRSSICLLPTFAKTLHPKP
jgi:hypothetical protein